MSLEDLVPEDKRSSRSSQTSSSSGSLTSPEDHPDYKVIGGGRWQKAFHIDQWEEIKDVIHHEFGLNVNRVLNSPAEERWDILHKAALSLHGNDDIEYRSEIRCGVCGNACDDMAVIIGSETFCPHHTAGQVAAALEDNNA